jgi:uncharacterized membrane protein YphA (DoxX/SURF4 family)
MVEPIVEKQPEKSPRLSDKPQFLDQMKTHITDTIAYVFLAFGLLYCFFEPFFSGILVGAILGVYFFGEIIQNAKKFKDFIVENGIFKGFTLLAALCAFVITAPGMCVGLIAGTILRYVYEVLF